MSNGSGVGHVWSLPVDRSWPQSAYMPDTTGSIECILFNRSNDSWNIPLLKLSVNIFSGYIQGLKLGHLPLSFLLIPLLSCPVSSHVVWRKSQTHWLTRFHSPADVLFFFVSILPIPHHIHLPRCLGDILEIGQSPTMAQLPPCLTHDHTKCPCTNTWWRICNRHLGQPMTFLTWLSTDWWMCTAVHWYCFL